MSNYLFGRITGKCIGMINNEQVVINRTTSGKTMVTLGADVMLFDSRREALTYLRNLADKADKRKAAE